MIGKSNEEPVALKKKKSKKVDENSDESNLKRKVSAEDTEVAVKKKKKKDESKVTEENIVTDEVLEKKKKPYFRDKGEKKVKDDDDLEDTTKAKSKFSISLPVGDAGTTPDLPVLKSTGKGPKIVIAQEKKVEAKKTEAPKKLSKRKRKHLKAEGSLPDESVHESKGMGKALRYLKTWEEDRDSWKFEKCRQIWLLHNAYDDSKVPGDIFPSLLNYMESIKGGMRQGAIDIAKQKVEKGKKWEEQSEGKSEEELQKELGDKLSDVEIKRSNQILELLSC